MNLLRNPLAGLLALVLLGLALYLPGLASLPVIDRDEARFAQATRQMLETGDYVRIKFQEQPRHKKPIAIYWLQAAAASISGTVDRIWPYRLPSVLGALLAVLATYLAGRFLVGPLAALVGGGLLASCLLVVFEAHFATTDAALMAAAALAQGALGWIYVRRRKGESPGWGPALVFWAAQGAGILLKGPVVPMVSLLTVLALVIADRSWRWLGSLRPLAGLALALAMAAPWLVSIHLATEGAFFSDAVQKDLLPKLIGGHEGHGFPPGYYLGLMMIAFWPGSLLVWQGLGRAFKENKDPAVRFCLAWLLPSWLVFELIPTKLPHYVLPLYPALALLTARFVLAAREVYAQRPPRPAAWLGFGLWGLIWLALSGGILVLSWRLAPGIPWVALIPAAAGLGMVALFWRLARSRRLDRAALISLGAGVIFLGATFQWVLPAWDQVWVSRQAAQEVARAAAPGTKPLVASLDYNEPSLVFYLGTATRLVDSPEKAARHLLEHPQGFCLVPAGRMAAFMTEASRQGLAVKRVAKVDGFNYTKGKKVELLLYASAGKAAPASE